MLTGNKGKIQAKIGGRGLGVLCGVQPINAAVVDIKIMLCLGLERTLSWYKNNVDCLFQF